MTLLQPSDVPSRSGINNAITSEIANHASLTDLASLHYDSGWITLTLNAGWSATGETPQYRRIGSAVYVRGRVTDADASITAGTYQIATLPVGFRPTVANMVFAFAGGSGTTSAGRLFVTSGGVITINPGNTTISASLAMTFLAT